MPRCLPSALGHLKGDRLSRLSTGAGQPPFAAACSCAVASKTGELLYSLSPTGQKQVFFQGLLALLPFLWVCEVRIWGFLGGAGRTLCDDLQQSTTEVRSFFTGETCGRGPEPSRGQDSQDRIAKPQLDTST